MSVVDLNLAIKSGIASSAAAATPPTPQPVTSAPPAVTSQPAKPVTLPSTGITITPVAIPAEDSIFRTAHFLKVALLGEPGVRKTGTACATLPPECYALDENGDGGVALADIDGKGSEMTLLTPLRRSGVLDIYDLSAELTSAEDMIARVRSGEHVTQTLPQGYLRVVETVNFLMGEGAAFKAAVAAHAKGQGPRPRRYNTVVIDSFSRMAEHVQTLTAAIKKLPDLEGFAWGRYGEYLTEFMSKAVVKSRRNVIVTCHISEVWKGIGAQQTVAGYKPAISGAFRTKFLSYFNDAFYLRSKLVTGGKYEYFMLTQRSDMFPARTSITNLPAVCPQNLALTSAVWKAQLLGDEVAEKVAMAALAMPVTSVPGQKK